MKELLSEWSCYDLGSGVWVVTFHDLNIILLCPFRTHFLYYENNEKRDQDNQKFRESVLRSLAEVKQRKGRSGSDLQTCNQQDLSMSFMVESDGIGVVGTCSGIRCSGGISAAMKVGLQIPAPVPLLRPNQGNDPATTPLWP